MMTKSKHDMTIGEKLKERRLEMNLTQQELANRIGVKHNSVCNWETDVRVPKDQFKKKLAKELNTTIMDLFYS